jgi:hypothetical protein
MWIVKRHRQFAIDDDVVPLSVVKVKVARIKNAKRQDPWNGHKGALYQFLDQLDMI